MQTSHTGLAPRNDLGSPPLWPKIPWVFLGWNFTLLIDNNTFTLRLYFVFLGPTLFCHFHFVAKESSTCFSSMVVASVGSPRFFLALSPRVKSGSTSYQLRTGSFISLQWGQSYCWWLEAIRQTHQLRLVVEIPVFIGSYTSQVVVWDFWTINSIKSVLVMKKNKTKLKAGQEPHSP